jgi:hypothetical protein
MREQSHAISKRMDTEAHLGLRRISAPWKGITVSFTKSTRARVNECVSGRNAMATDTGPPSLEWYPDIWKTSYRVEVKPREHFPEGKMIETTVAAHTYQLYPHEARYLRDLLNAADLGPTRMIGQ